jgi:hypothetical protein
MTATMMRLVAARVKFGLSIDSHMVISIGIEQETWMVMLDATCTIWRSQTEVFVQRQPIAFSMPATRIEAIRSEWDVD